MPYPKVGLLIALTLQIGWSRCGLPPPPPSNEITQNFLWNTGKLSYRRGVRLLLNVNIIIIIIGFRADAVEWRIGEWEPCTRSEDTGLDYNQGIRRRKISCVMVIHDGIKLEVSARIPSTNVHIFSIIITNIKVQHCVTIQNTMFGKNAFIPFLE